MSVRLVAYSPQEQMLFSSIPQLQESIEQVAQMVLDLGVMEDVELLFTVTEDDNPNYFSLAFSGTTMSLEFTPEIIQVVDFNDGDEIILQDFERHEVNQATTWLVNEAKS